MSGRNVLLNAQTLRIVAAGATSVLFKPFAQEQHCGRESECFNPLRCPSTSQAFSFAVLQESIPGKILTSAFSLLEPNYTAMQANSSHRDMFTNTENKASVPKQTATYDFVIVGNGNAGKSAVKTLRDICPDASIAVVDPFRPTPQPDSGKNDRVEYYADTVTGCHPYRRTIHLLSESTIQLKYRHGVLVATGTRGAPPPLELFQEGSLHRLLEVRTTELTSNTKRPVLPPDQVRLKFLKSVSKGANVAILGSGWEAIELAAAAQQAKAQGRVVRPKQAKPILVFGSPGPAWNILPQYLSSELRKKMRKQGIEIQDRSIVRYIANVNQDATQSRSARQKLELHTAKTYDLLETQRKLLDWILLAPDTTGTKGTAALPTTEVPDRMRDSSDGRPWYKTWSQVSKTSPYEPSSVVCFDDDGRISVNTELCAASKIYAAGSVAKYPNTVTGHAMIAGEGVMDATVAGRIGALNMSRDVVNRHAKSHYTDSDETESLSFAANSVPVWRSDISPHTSAALPSSLSTIGVQALCIGNCDSERQGTRAFWWTNTSAQRRLARMMEEDEEAGDEGVIRRKTRRRNTRRRRQLGLVTPVYGIGIVYYLDKVGRIRGIMTWGLPFSSRIQTDSPELNAALLDRMKSVIATNGGISALDSEENYHVMNAFLAKESHHLVKLAIKGNMTDSTGDVHGLDGPVEGFSKPLYRYTEARQAKKSNLSVLRRTDRGGLGVLGEDLYARDELALEEKQAVEGDNAEEEMELQNLATPMYPINVVPYGLAESSKRTAATANSLAELNQFLAVQRGWQKNENRARPSKEDLLWLRPGDERRNTSQAQILIDYYKSLLFPHRS